MPSIHHLNPSSSVWPARIGSSPRLAMSVSKSTVFPRPVLMRMVEMPSLIRAYLLARGRPVVVDSAPREREAALHVAEARQALRESFIVKRVVNQAATYRN